jgi:uncharacterized protein YjiS (DUF1127 family)
MLCRKSNVAASDQTESLAYLTAIPYGALHHGGKRPSPASGPGRHTRRIVTMNLSNDAHSLPDTQQKIVSDSLRLLSWAHARLRRLGDSWIARRQRARELDELYRFTDRDLSDLGLSRSDLPAIQQGVYRRE